MSPLIAAVSLIAASLIAANCYALSLAKPGNIATSSLQVHLPTRAQPIPEPLAPGQHPGFKYRGIKGWDWTPEQYLEEIPWLVKFKMNFLMNCYLSMFASTHPWKNGWWEPLPEAKKAAYDKVIRACQTNGIIFCFCMNPQLRSRQPLNPMNASDIDKLFRHYAWAQSQGVRWFSICLDDVAFTQSPSVVASEDAKMVNTVLARLRQKDPAAQMVFCPGPYWGDGSNPADHAYLETLGQQMNRTVYVFWTGDNIVTPRITLRAAKSYEQAVKHRLFLWDNYPVNDDNPTLNLGPVKGRASDLGKVVYGYLSNPMCSQNEINNIPLATCADYAYNPQSYKPGRAIGQAILLFAKTPPQQEVLKRLVETYPGFLIVGGGTGTNPVRNRFKEFVATRDFSAEHELLQRMEKLSAQFDKEFPREFEAAKKTVAADVVWMKGHLTQER